MPKKKNLLDRIADRYNRGMNQMADTFIPPKKLSLDELKFRKSAPDVGPVGAPEYTKKKVNGKWRV